MRAPTHSITVLSRPALMQPAPDVRDNEGTPETAAVDPMRANLVQALLLIDSCMKRPRKKMNYKEGKPRAPKRGRKKKKVAAQQ